MARVSPDKGEASVSATVGGRRGAGRCRASIGQPSLRPELDFGFREGNTAVLDAVYRTYVEPVQQHLRSLTWRLKRNSVPEPAIEDMVQDTFLRALSPKARMTYDSNREYLPYLKAIATNCLRDFLRTSGQQVPTNPIETGVDDCTDTPESDDPKLRGIIQTTVNGLPTELRAVFDQRFLLGRSQAVASAALGITRSALRTKEKQLRHGLHKELQSKGVVVTEVLPTERAAREKLSPAAGPSGTQRLASLEATIRRGLRTWVEMAMALVEIRDRRLYREAGFNSFEAYCRDRWDLQRRHAYRLIEAVDVVETVSQGTQEVPPPTSERHARELAKLKTPAERVAAWSEAVRTAPGGKVTARHVATLVRKRLAMAKSVSAPRGNGPANVGVYSSSRTVMLLVDLKSTLDDILTALSTSSASAGDPHVGRETAAAIDTTISKLRAIRARLGALEISTQPLGLGENLGQTCT
jgi:RNA polymerase sigma factor (sigma-70 family)